MGLYAATGTGPVDLPGGGLLAPGKRITLTDEAAKHPHVQMHVTAGRLTLLDDPKRKTAPKSSEDGAK